MNEYQKYIFKKFDHANNFIFTSCQPVDDGLDGSLEQYGAFDGETDTFHIRQDDDINKTKYILLMDTNSIYLYHFQPFEEVLVYKNDQWEALPSENGQYRLIADFNDRISKIRFVFANNIADDYILTLDYTEADKEKYYAKLAEEKKENLLATAEIKISTGADLANIYFQPCCEEYDHSEIQLFIPKDSDSSLQKSTNWSLIKKCAVPTDDFFKSIGGLAYGQYAIILKQFDKENNLLIETDYMTFSIRKPTPPQFVNVI